LGVIPLVCLLIGLLAATPARAAGGGKLVVRVTGEGRALAGAHLHCLDPTMGAAADLDGTIILLGLPPGLRRVRVSHLGYTPVLAEAWIVSGETCRLALDLSPGELVSELTVHARRLDRPLERGSRVSVLDGESLQHSPVRGLDGLLALEAGLTRDERGQLHVRGGRAGELKIMIDGMEVQDPWSGAWQGLLNEEEVQELVLVAGAFNAEYGDAMSGVVNIVTRQGAPRPTFLVRHESAGLLPSPWRRSHPFDGVADEEEWRKRSWRDLSSARPGELLVDLPGRAQVGLGGPLAAGWEGRLALLAQGEDSHLPHGYLRAGDLRLGLGRALGKGRIDLSWERTRAEEMDYLHAWKYLPVHQSRERRGQDRWQAVATHSWTPRLMGTLRLAWQRHHAWRGVLDEAGEPLPLDQWERPTWRAEQDFYRAGHSPTFSRRGIEQWRLGAEAAWQAGPHHEWKTGLDLRRDDLAARTVHNVWSGPASREYFDDRVHARPLQGALFLQDKLEYPHLVVNAGLRLDWQDPAVDWLPDPLQPFVEREGAVEPADFTPVDPRWSLSPRLGLAFPFGDEAVLSAAWGEFTQFAPLSALYGNRALELDHALVPLVGNPRVKPQRTTTWELGLNRRLGEGGRLGLAAWYKDLRDLLSTREVIQYTRRLVVYHNTDYANVRGIDLSWSRALGRAGHLRLDYTWMSARGNAAEPESGLILARAGEEEEFNEFPLDYEQTHDLAGRLTLALPRGLGLELAAELGSGLPYTPFIDVGVEVPTNSARRPWTLRSDAALRWAGDWGGGRLEAWLAVQNLLDRRNVVMVYPATGKPFHDPRGLIGSTPDALHDPSRVEAPRQARVGVEWSW
jgi:outer membrane receptor protein involved in Fe transport